MRPISPFRFSIVGTNSLSGFAKDGLATVSPSLSDPRDRQSLERSFMFSLMDTTSDLIQCFHHMRSWSLWSYPREADHGELGASHAQKRYYVVVGCDYNEVSILDALEAWLAAQVGSEDAVEKTYDAFVSAGVFDKPDAIYLGTDQGFPHIRALKEYFNVQDFTTDTVGAIVSASTAPSKISDSYVEETPSEDQAPEQQN